MSLFKHPYPLLLTYMQALGKKSPEFASLAQRLENGEVQVADQTIEFTERAPDGGGDISLTPKGKLAAEGLRTLSGNTLEKSFFFMPTHITVLAASGVLTSSDADLLGANFEPIEELAIEALNGNFTLKNDSTPFITNLSNHSFARKLYDDKGAYHLFTTRLFKEQTTFDIRLLSMPAVANTAYKVILHGIGTQP